MYMNGKIKPYIHKMLFSKNKNCLVFFVIAYYKC